MTQFSSLKLRIAWDPLKILCLDWFPLPVFITQTQFKLSYSVENWKHQIGVFSFWVTLFSGKIVIFLTSWSPQLLYCHVSSDQFNITVAKKTISLAQFLENISAKIFPPFSLPSHISLLHQIEAWSGFSKKKKKKKRHEMGLKFLYLGLNWSEFDRSTKWVLQKKKKNYKVGLKFLQIGRASCRERV